MKRNTKIALVMMALSAMAMGSTSAFAHGGHGMWQQNAAPLTSEQQTAWQKIHNDFYAQSSALQQQLVTKRYEYNALLAANPPDSSKINAVAKEMENLRQSLDELRVKRDIAMAEAGIPRGALMNPLMILVKIIKLRWIHILSYDQMVSRKINNQTTRCANSIFYTTLFTNSAPNYT